MAVNDRLGQKQPELELPIGMSLSQLLKELRNASATLERKMLNHLRSVRPEAREQFSINLLVVKSEAKFPIDLEEVLRCQRLTAMPM